MLRVENEHQPRGLLAESGGGYTMARLTIAEGMLIVTMQGVDKVLALRGTLAIPLTHIRGIDVRPAEAQQVFHGLRVGTSLPGVITAGTFYTSDGKYFYDVHDPQRTIGITLDGDTYSRLILDVGNDETPEAAAARIEQAIGRA